ncbi:MAG: methyltransferase domain-containing protein [Vicinamibacterales bacterium]|nr:methyltransferase domain-containing protein [Vicinamibacterales bacterium]
MANVTRSNMHFEDSTVLQAAAHTVIQVPGAALAVDAASPNWIATDDRGLRLIGLFDGRTPLREVVLRYAAETSQDAARAWLHVDTFARDAVRQGFLSAGQADPAPYLGRAHYLETDHLEELWLHVNDFCNLACAHCLVSSGPDRSQGMPTAFLIGVIDQAVALGAARVFFTGGEPLARPDILELADRVVTHHGRELVVLTNGTAFGTGKLDTLTRLAGRGLLRVQISLDGATAGTNDEIRGTGTFDRIVSGIRAAVAAHLRPTLTMTLLPANLREAAALVALAAELGVANVHFLWPHRRGRLSGDASVSLPDAHALLDTVRQAHVAALACGVTVDNVEEFRLRVDGAPGIKNDLAGAGWTSLCVYTDGCVYPSASMAGVPDLRCGDLAVSPLERIWRTSPVLDDLRQASVEDKPQCRTCSLRFLCGGGDIEHGYWAATGPEVTLPVGALRGQGPRRRAAFLGHDPYCDVYKGLAADAFTALASEGRGAYQPSTGFDRPVVVRGMGDRTIHDTSAVVRTTHSACVLSDAAMARSHGEVQAFYGSAAETPQVELCCPVRPDAEDLAHIPQAVIDRFYGCGSPVSAASLVSGETMVDLGSGAGIDCFVAARKVGSAGQVIGVDMTDAMLAVADECRPQVAAALGWDVVEFRRGFLEAIPVESGTADVVTSNCVINLSPDKPRVFREMWRVLKDHGRVVLADIVADGEVPPKMRADGRLWGECISGALTEEAFLAQLERAGFYGVSVLRKTFWREVEGYRFFSVTARGYKFEKKAGCTYVGQYAVYLGPLKAAIDEEGHFFPRGVPVEVCTDTAAKLSHPPYRDTFAVVDGETGDAEIRRSGECGTNGGACC